MTQATASETPDSHVSDSPGSESSLWQNVSFALAHAVASGLLACLSLGGLYRFGCFFGTLEYLVDRGRRRRFAVAMERVLEQRPSGSEYRRLARRFFMQNRCDKLFFLVLDRIPRDRVISLLSITNRDLLDSAVARGHGAYLAFSHHGAHHVTGLLLAIQGYKNAGVRDRNVGGLRRYVQGRLARRYPEFEQTRWLFSDSYPRDIYRLFQQGYVLGSAMDVTRPRTPQQKTEHVDIFGERRPFLSGPLRVALRCGAPALQVFIIAEPGFRYRLEVVGELAGPEGAKDEESAVRDAMRTYAANVERYVRRYPSLVSRV